MKIKENNVLSVTVDDKFVVEYDKSIPRTLNIYHNNEEAKIHLKSLSLDFEVYCMDLLVTLAQRVYEMLGIIETW